MVTITKTIGVFFIWILVLHLLCAAEKVSSGHIFFGNTFCSFRASLVAQMEKRLPAIGETQVWSLGQEDPLEKEMATHSSFLAWEILWTEKPGRLQSMGSQRVGRDCVASLSFFPFLCSFKTTFWNSQNLYQSVCCNYSTSLPKENHFIFLRKNEIFFFKWPIIPQ